MRKLIKADARRILRKKIIGFVFIGLLLYMMINQSADYGIYEDPYVAVKTMIKNLNVFGIVLGILIFFGVYADDFKSACYVIAIGRGTSRNRVIMAKLLESAGLLAIMYGIMLVVLTMTVRGFGYRFDDTLMMAWYGSVIIGYYKTIGYIALASLILYITNNIPLAVIALVVMFILVPSSPVLLGLNQELSKYHLERYHYAGLADNALSDIMFGAYVSGILKLLFGLVVYFGGVLLITTILFDKKELEF